MEQKEAKAKRRRTGGPLMGAFPDVDKRILDLRKHHVSNDKRYVVAKGRDYVFFKNLTKARVCVVTKGMGRPMSKADEKKALMVAKPGLIAKQLKELREVARSAGFKLVKK